MGYFDDIPDGGGTATAALASTFADPNDLRRYFAARSNGASEREALAVGDNGTSAFGDDTTRENDPIVGLPPDTPGFVHNRLIELTGPDGQTGVARLSEKMPATKNLKGEATIDLNPAAAKLVGHPGGVYPVTWRFIDQPNDNSSLQPADLFADIPTKSAPGAVSTTTTSGASAPDYFADVPIAQPAKRESATPNDAASSVAPASNADETSQLRFPRSWKEAGLNLAIGLDDLQNRAKQISDFVAPGFWDQTTSSPLPATHLAPDAKDSYVKAAGKAATNVVTGFVEATTSPAMLATGLAGATGLARPIAAGFGAYMAANLPEQWQQVQKAEKTPPGSQERWEASLNLAASLGFIHALGKEATKPFNATSQPAQPTVPDLRSLGNAPGESAAGSETVSLPAAQPPEPAIAPPATGDAPLTNEVNAALNEPPAALPPTDTQVAGATVRAVPTEQIASRPELMQFKRMDDTATGQNAADTITTTYDPLKAGNLLLWEPNNPAQYGLTKNQRYIVANGHHRDAAAKQQAVPEQNAQVLRESDGFSAGDARAIAAESNIADGKGTIYDAAKFVRERAATHGTDEALGRARQIGARGEKASTIALAASPDTWASFVNEQITPDQTAAIARSAPGSESLQRLGIQRAAAGATPNEIGNFLQAVQAKLGAAPAPKQIDLFGSDDAAIKQAEEMGKRAGAIQREIGDQINAVAGAAKRPEKAAALGVNVSDPASVNAKLAGLQRLRERAKNWAADDQIRTETLSGDKTPADIVAGLQSSQDIAPSVAENEGGSYGNVPGLLRPLRTNDQSAATAAGARPVSDLARSLATRTDFLQQNRENLARVIQAAGSDVALTNAGIGSERAREYARESLRQFAEKARSGVLPSRPFLPIYRGDFEANKVQYGRASQHAFMAVQNGLQSLGLNPAEHLFASGTSQPRLRPGEKGTADLFQASDQPFNLIGETGIDYSARQAKEAADKKKIEDAARAQDEAQGRLFAQGTAAPRFPATISASPTSKSLALPPPASAAIEPLRSWWFDRTLGIRKLVAPQTIDGQAFKTANIIREYNGKLANKLMQADAALEEWRKSFDQTPVPRGWYFEEGKPLPRNYAFIDQSERAGRGLTPNELALKKQLDAISDESVDEVRRVAPAALKVLIDDYFPHIWKDPDRAKRVFATLISSRPLEGSKSFLKQRSLDYFKDGLRAGLVPISDNPIDLYLTKLHEIRKFVAAQDILRETKAIGARKFVYIFEPPPEGWTRVEDPSTNVHAPPFVTVPEAFDEQMRVKTVEVLDSLGIQSQRLASLGGKRWGTYQEGGAGIKTKFAGPLSVYFHELGHGLQERYRWIDQILGDVSLTSKDPLAVELRNLADLRLGEEPTKSFRKYVRSKDEKAAVMLEGYIHAPERMREVAPTIFARVRQFIADRPELRGINEIRPSLTLGDAKQQIPVGGMVTLGHYYMPEGAAAVLRNYLSPGLQRHGLVRNVRTISNVLNSAQLGLSAFHAGFTSIDAIVSTWALGLRYLSEGKIMRGISRIGLSPLAPVTNYFSGKAIQNEMLRPGSAEVKMLGFRHKLSPAGQAAVENYAKLAVQSGLRATVDPFWKTQITRNMTRAWHEGGVRGYAGTVLRLPFAISEQLMRPILETLVPRQKLGVFAGMAREAMDRLGPDADIHDVRGALARAADATEDRMGQMTYDNLFYNRIVKEAALIGFRAYGWTFGKYRALLGGIGDTIRTPGRIAAGEPVLTDRMAYLLALPMVTGAIGSVMNYAMTGQAPQDWRDAFMPRTGKLDANGNPQRISPPTYVKEWLSDWFDFPDLKKMLTSFYQKLNPAIAVGVDVLRNADFTNTKVFNEDDPWLKQQWEKVAFVLRSAEPFAIRGALKLNESRPTFGEYFLPFFGFVPAKSSLTMTPAQNRAAELMRNQLPAGARTQEQAEHAGLMKQLVQDLKAGGHIPSLAELHTGDLKALQKRVGTTPFKYQLTKLGLDDAMKVWDLANTEERAQIRELIINKVGRSKAVPLDRKQQYLKVLLNQEKP
jgi:hypothetical protein